MASYSIATFLAMMIYWGLLLDLAIFSMRISAYVPWSSLGELPLESLDTSQKLSHFARFWFVDACLPKLHSSCVLCCHSSSRTLLAISSYMHSDRNAACEQDC